LQNINIPLLVTNDDGSVDALKSTGATNSILKVLSTIYKTNLQELGAKIFIKNGTYYLSYRQNCDDSQLIDAGFIELTEQKLYAITRAIHENPNNPRLAVFKEVGMTAQEFDFIVSEISDNRPLYNSLGFIQQRDKSKIQLEPVSHLIAKQPAIKKYNGCIAAVCTYAVQPYVEFFHYNSRGILQQYNGTFSRIEASVSHEVALKLDDIRIRGKLKSDETVLIITVIETPGGVRKYELLGFDFLGQNRNLDFN